MFYRLEVSSLPGSLVSACSNPLFSDALLIPSLHTNSAIMNLQLSTDPYGDSVLTWFASWSPDLPAHGARLIVFYSTVPNCGTRGYTARLLDFSPYLILFSINDSFALLDLPPQHVISHLLQFQGGLAASPFPIQLFGTALETLLQTISFFCLVAQLTGTQCPLLELGEPLLKTGYRLDISEFSTTALAKP